MPMTRTQHADYTAQYGGWSPNERAFFINRLYQAASHGEIHEVAGLMMIIQRIATQMNANFQPRPFTLTALRNMLHRLRLDYVEFCEFLENPWVDYDPIDVKVTVRAPYWQTVNPRVLDEILSTCACRMSLLVIGDTGCMGSPTTRGCGSFFYLKSCAILPPEVVGSPEWPIHILANDEDALAVIPFNLPRGIVPEATPPQPVSENGQVIVNGDEGGAGRVEENMTGLFGHGLWHCLVDFFI
ncbi:hypothetical protein ACJIZ3_005838 [Penstemon smallii]|uniref:Uncharacterized protein n=1 Tax=Penstemon smallii TaxID=265156 RepID=A0ABD3S651_9LAMI